MDAAMQPTLNSYTDIVTKKSRKNRCAERKCGKCQAVYFEL